MTKAFRIGGCNHSKCKWGELFMTKVIQSDPDFPGPDLPEPRFTGRVNFPQYGKMTVFDPDLPGKTLSLGHPDKSGSDCISILSCLFQHFDLIASWIVSAIFYIIYSTNQNNGSYLGLYTCFMMPHEEAPYHHEHPI
eukprot:sb/3474496/